MYFGSRFGLTRIGLKGISWRRSRREVSVGAEFRRVRRNNTIETAKVLSLVEDSFGIPHVKYALTLKSLKTAPYTDGPRLLALKAFERAYPDRAGV